MAGDWIKMRTNLDTDPAVVRIASGLKTDRYSVVGRLHRIWSWANEHLTDGLDVPIDSDFLDSLVETPGFSEQLRRVGWLTGRDGSLSFPQFERHNGASAKSRAMDSERKRSVRKMSGSQPDKTRTREEKRREEKRDTHTHTLAENGKATVPTELSECWSRWCAFRLSIDGREVGDIQAESVLMELGRRGADKAARDIEFSIRKNARTILDSDNDFERRGAPQHRTTKKRVGI